jgi:hypothetical protein
MMDGRFVRDLVGYNRWHVFIRACVLLGTDVDTWLQIDRLVVLAWYIQSALTPVQRFGQDPKNEYMEENRLNKLRNSYLQWDFRQIDDAFHSYSPMRRR